MEMTGRRRAARLIYINAPDLSHAHAHPHEDTGETHMTDFHDKLKRVEQKSWLYTKRTLIGVASVLVILLMLLIAFSAAP